MIKRLYSLEGVETPYLEMKSTALLSLNLEMFTRRKNSAVNDL